MTRDIESEIAIQAPSTGRGSSIIKAVVFASIAAMMLVALTHDGASHVEEQATTSLAATATQATATQATATQLGDDSRRRRRKDDDHKDKDDSPAIEVVDAKLPEAQWNCTNVLDWNFFDATVTQNNLGGVGPDTGVEELRFSGVKPSVDLVVTYNKELSLDPQYMVNKGPAVGSKAYVRDGCDVTITAYDDPRYCGARNGLYAGAVPGFFGQINVANGYEGYFDFALVHTGTNTPIDMKEGEKLLFSFYDLDDNRNPKFPLRREFIEFVTPPASHALTSDTTVVASINAAGDLYAQSGRFGTGFDNPNNPLNMTAIAESSKISVTYSGLSKWAVKFGTKGFTKGDMGGRNMLFAGRSKGDCACVGVSDWNIQNNLESNNLGGLGPAFSDPQELRYSKVFQTGYSKKVDIDLVIRNTTKYKVANTAYNGLWPTKSDTTQMGQFNVECGTETTFNFTFMESGTNNAYDLTNIFFSVYDLDALDRFKNAEYVVFPTPVTNYSLTTPTQVAKSGKNDGTLKFSSTTPGIVADNPTNPKALTGLQMARSVTIWQSGGSNIQATLGHYIDEADFKKTGSSWPKGKDGLPKVGGRNFLFAGPGIYCPAPSTADPAVMTTMEAAAPTTKLGNNRRRRSFKWHHLFARV